MSGVRDRREDLKRAANEASLAQLKYEFTAKVLLLPRLGIHVLPKLGLR
jgi:hypothetical protein